MWEKGITITVNGYEVLVLIICLRCVPSIRPYLTVLSLITSSCAIITTITIIIIIQLLTSSNQQQETTMTECKGTTTTTTSSQPGDDPDAISWLRTTLHNVDQRCSNLQTDLKKAQQVTIDRLQNCQIELQFY